MRPENRLHNFFRCELITCPKMFLKDATLVGMKVDPFPHSRLLSLSTQYLPNSLALSLFSMISRLTEFPWGSIAEAVVAAASPAIVTVQTTVEREFQNGK